MSFERRSDPMTELLEGRVALVTGGASGIGEAACRLFASQGAAVTVCDVQDDLGGSVASSLARGAFHHTDVTDEGAVAAAFDRTVDEFGQLDIVFACAGVIGAVGRLVDTSVDAFDRTVAIHLRGAFLCLKHAARVMTNGGSVVLMSSIAGVQGGYGPHAYSAAKTGIVGLTRSACAELGADGIRVNCICAGSMVSPMTAAALTGDADRLAETAAELAVRSPLRRAGTADDIAQAALWLSSDHATYINGVALVVDAGVTAAPGAGRLSDRGHGGAIWEAGRREA
jgi:NAD(P)-dependent dehydrogenase (short-subunit alcohol dehydrogenase family)